MRRPLRQRGQVMVLGALGVLIVAVTLLLTLNVGNSVYNKIRLQQLSDAASFSQATQEARAFNYFAYTNRANIGSLVAAVSAHSIMSMASSVPEMFNAASNNFIAMAIEELALCMTCCWPFCFSMCQHCIHAFNDTMIAMDYSDEADDLRDSVSDLDQAFRYLIMALDYHMQMIHADQLIMVAKVSYGIINDDIPHDLTSTQGFLPDGVTLETHNMVRFLTLQQFLNTIETDETKNKWVPTEIANGTLWSSGGMGGGKMPYNHPWPYLFVWFATLLDLMFDIPDDGMSFVISHEGQGRVVKDPGSPPEPQISNSNNGPDGNAVSAYDDGTVLSLLENNCFPLFISDYEAWVTSDANGGDHENSGSCGESGNHDLKCLSEGVLGTGGVAGIPQGCFVLYKSNPEPGNDFNQPSVFSLFTQDLRVLEQGGRAPWEINDEGHFELDLGAIGSHHVQISNDPNRTAESGGSEPGEGVAMSKSLVYYHLPSDWKEAPNFFNPFWRAKLHPFKSLQAVEVLGAAGLTKYEALLTVAPLP
jgi:hypothetical protein